MYKKGKSINLPPLTAYHLQTKTAIKEVVVDGIGSAFTVTQESFGALQGITCFTVEVWEECMRLPHWHPNAAELGYVVSGMIEVIIWRSPGESAVFTLGPGMCWFIPKAALHSLNNIGKDIAKLLVGFSSELPQDIDLPVAFNGIPAPIRSAYTSPHVELRSWQGTATNPLFGRYKADKNVNEVLSASPYGFDLKKVTPLYENTELGSVVWGIKDNWPILEEISLLRARLLPGIARDPIWYPDVGTLYVVSSGKGQFNLIIGGYEPEPFNVAEGDYIFVPMGILHTFSNLSSDLFEVIAFFTNANPQPEVSLSVATAFFPNNLRQSALMTYGKEERKGNPLENMNFKEASPYLIHIND